MTSGSRSSTGGGVLASGIGSLFSDEGAGWMDVAEAALALLDPASGPQAMEAWQSDPWGWAERYLGVPQHTIRWSLSKGYERHRWDGSVDPMAQLGDALVACEDVGLESGTGTGKSFAMAVLILWFIAVWRGGRVFTFAAKEEQLRLYIWTEIRKLWPRFRAHFPAAELTDLRIRMLPGSDAWGAWGRSAGVGADEEVSAKAAGMHAPHMLIVVEEGQGVDAAIQEAIENTCTAPHNLRVTVGNPDHQHDPLHLFCTSPGVRHVRASALDHPNIVLKDADVVPGAVSLEAVERRKARYGEQGRLYRSRVRGISPEESAEALIKAVWVREAFARYLDEEQRRELEAQGYPGLGVDVAQSDGGDDAAIARGQGAVLHEVSSFPVGESHTVRDSSVLGVNVATEVALKGISPRHVGIDPVGVGAGTVNKVRELGLLVPSLNGGERPWASIDEDLLREKGKGQRVEELFYNLRAQMHWQMRLDLEHGRIAIAPDEDLLHDLTTPLWETRNGKILIESKEDIRERLKRSPNKGDAAVYWNFVRWRRAMPEEPEAIDVFDPETLAHHAKESRRIREKPQRRRKTNPLITEHVP